MNPESSNKYFYRYAIDNLSPLTASSHSRKILKASQNPTTHLMIDLTGTKDILGIDFDLLNGGHPYQMSYLCKPLDSTFLMAHKGILEDQIYNFVENKEELELLRPSQNIQILCSPKTTSDLSGLVLHFSGMIVRDVFWSFEPYQSQICHSLTLKDISKSGFPFKTLCGLEIFNSDISPNFELEPLADISWSFATCQQSIKLSVIIPSFNNVIFLSNVLAHLIAQSMDAQEFEIVVVEDGGQDHSSEILKELFNCYQNKINLKFIYWTKLHPTKGPQNFFRAGLARNLGVRFSVGEMIVFLDSDMIVPTNFLETVKLELKAEDVVQFQRYHLNQRKSLQNPSYQSVNLMQDTYIEEKNYWNQLFDSTEWKQLENYWKFTCTYALALKRNHFLKVGRFKKYYISYGFEDTDLGYELFKLGLRFKLIKIPLFHLTSYNLMQYKNSHMRKLYLLRKTASLFYLQHLDPAIFELFGNFYRFQKSLAHWLRDLLAK